jgi:predicted DNA-binding transcriptional regulator AlpA
VQSRILSGWKDIANYLGKGVRTVQRYERELALPVRRPAGKTRGSVIATQSELDTWVASRLTDRPHPVGVTPPLAVCSSLRDQIAEMDELAERMKKLRLDMRSSREMLCATIQRLHDDTNREPSASSRIVDSRIPLKGAS